MLAVQTEGPLYRIMDYASFSSSLLLFLLHLSNKCLSSSSAGLGQYCQWEKFEAKCASDEVVIMEQAVYGRMRLGRCVDKDLGYLGCQKDVLSLADQKCSGRRSCTIDIPDRDFEKEKPCLQLQNYFEGSYRCLKVEGTQHPACRSGDYVKLTSPSGYIASSTTETSGCGSADTPWLIEALPGQKIAVSLMDFGGPAVQKTSGVDVCRVYAVLKEEASRKSVTICGAKGRNVDIYTTTGNSLEVRVLGKTSQVQRMHFLIRWQVLGCGDLQLPPGGTFIREGNKATVSCDHSGDSWHIHCNGTTWNGYMGNCSSGAHTAASTNSPFQFSFGVSIIIIVAIAVAIGTLILGIGLVFFRRRGSDERRRAMPNRPPESTYEDQGRPLPPCDLAYRDAIVSMHYSGKMPIHTYADIRNEYTHVWDRPLPRPDLPAGVQPDT